MSVSEALGEPRTVDVPAGPIDYRERGSGPPIVFVHGVGVNGDLWRRVVPELAGGHRCIAPDLPLGAHVRPLRRDADMSLPGLARTVAGFLEALDLDDVAIVANDTGGAVAQWLVGHHPERIGRLVLTSCDAFEKFPPTPQLYLKPAARVPGLLWCVARAVQWKAVQRMPMAYGWTTSAPIDPAIMRSYTEPVYRNAGVRRDLARLLRAVDTRYTHEAAASLRGFDRPALVAWAADDRLFPLDHGRRLAELLPQGRFETIADSRTFIPEEQPERLGAMVRDFLAEREAAATTLARHGAAGGAGRAGR
jgi:pimeloyl-ACP methyl ester carboxylesterase